MEPATVAGLVLGAIPLIIAAAENYEVTFQPFVTYRRYSKEILRFSAKLDTQRAIFHNTCQILLLSVGQDLADILRDQQHPARNDDELSKKLSDLLGSSFDSCTRMLELINDTLNEVTEETKGFASLIDIENRLTDIVNELRSYNEDLGRLSNQIRKLSVNSLPSTTGVVTTALAAHLRLAQQASGRLYQALAASWPCEETVEHVARMSLVINERIQNANSLRFDIAVVCGQNPPQHEVPWFSIDSRPSATLEEHGSYIEHSELKSELENLGARSRVRFDLPASGVGSSISARGPAPDTHINLLQLGRLCQYFRRLQSPEPCLGFLQKTNTFKHFVYKNPQASQVQTQSFGSSLKDVLRSDLMESRESDWIQKLQLARLLTLAVLRFHGTKWLPESWGSNNITFMTSSNVPEIHHSLNAPCLDVQLPTGATGLQPQTKSIISASGIATNPTLFSLGVVLIELGYNEPFETLSKENHETFNTNSHVADFMAARRLSESVHRKLNKTYGRLVEKCINCNFGVATKLEEAGLQSAVFTQVVHQLDICLDQYKAFNALAPLPAGVTN